MFPPLLPSQLCIVKVRQIFDMLSFQKYRVPKTRKAAMMFSGRTFLVHWSGTLATVALHRKMCKGMIDAQVVEMQDSIRLACPSAGHYICPYSLLGFSLLSFPMMLLFSRTFLYWSSKRMSTGQLCPNLASSVLCSQNKQLISAGCLIKCASILAPKHQHIWFSL